MFIKGIYADFNSKLSHILEDLIKFKVVNIDKVSRFLFTEEGHNFYLKVLYQTKTAHIYD
jgi:hypothetical protein